MELWRLMRVLNMINISGKHQYLKYPRSSVENLIFLLSLYVYIHKLKNLFLTYMYIMADLCLCKINNSWHNLQKMSNQLKGELIYFKLRGIIKIYQTLEKSHWWVLPNRVWRVFPLYYFRTSTVDFLYFFSTFPF